MVSYYLIYDYRFKFYSSTRYWDASFDLIKLSEYFIDHGVNLKFVSFNEVIININTFKNQVVLFPSSEDKGNLYKGFIEDVVLALNEVGAILIPSYHLLRAHHNKVFMELYRKYSLSDKFNNLPTFVYGTYEEYLMDIDKFSEGYWVLKPSSGALSSGVKLLKSKSDKISLPRSISKSFFLKEYLKVFIKHQFRFKFKDYKRKSVNRNKFILQKFIPNLNGDYKVLIYGDKYYALERKNRKNDFRASGGGILNIDPILPNGLLDFARSFVIETRVPFVSLDIAFDGSDFYLIEFQCINFGNYTLEKSIKFFKYIEKTWVSFYEKSDLEKEFVNSIVRYINENRY